MRTKIIIALVAFLLLFAGTAFAAVNPASDPRERTAEPAMGVTGLGERLGAPETLTGRITMLNPENNIVIVETADGVPFNFLVRPSTRIQSGTQRLQFADLSTRIDRTVSVRFVPMRGGNVAQSIEITE